MKAERNNRREIDKMTGERNKERTDRLNGQNRERNSAEGL